MEPAPGNEVGERAPPGAGDKDLGDSESDHVFDAAGEARLPPSGFVGCGVRNEERAIVWEEAKQPRVGDGSADDCPCGRERLKGQCVRCRMLPTPRAPVADWRNREA